MMRCLPALCLLLLTGVLGCSGGGSNVTTTPVAAWPKFRHDGANTGAGNAEVAGVRPEPRVLAVDDGPISASPTIALDGTVYIVSEAGTIKAFTASGADKWSTQSCTACPSGDQNLGKMIASPAVVTVNNKTSVFVASVSSAAGSGRFYAIEDAGDHPICQACGDPRSFDPGVTDASFASSPGLTLHSVSSNVTSILIGASISRAEGEFGRVYALNSDGSLRWAYPRGQGLPAPVTSSPAVFGSTIYVQADNGILNALTTDGQLLWTANVGVVRDPDVAFAPSVVGTTGLIYANSVDGDVVAFSAATGSERWRRKLGVTLVASLALGVQPQVTTATPEPTVTPPQPTPSAVGNETPASEGSPTPITTATPTATTTPTFAGGASTLYALAKSGDVYVVDARIGSLVPAGQQEAIDADVLGSPALSTDSHLVFVSSVGSVYALNGSTLVSAWTKVPLEADKQVGVRSSIAIASDGTLWIGADNGNIYRLGAPGASPTPSLSPAATPSPTASPTGATTP